MTAVTVVQEEETLADSVPTLVAVSGRFVSAALQHRQPGIFGKSWVGRRTQAHVEDGSAIGLYFAHEAAIGAESDALLGL